MYYSTVIRLIIILISISHITLSISPIYAQNYKDCSNTSVNLVPLIDMKASDSYYGETGGLYGSGSNQIPASHENALSNATAEITPRNSSGIPDPNGKIGVVSVGMSNTKMEFEVLQQLAATDTQINSKIVLINGAESGQVAYKWADNDFSSEPWNRFNIAISSAGVTNEQVQVAWLKVTNYAPSNPQPGLSFAQNLRTDLATTIQKLKEVLPNLKVIYLTSRIYAGYTTYGLNPEPFAYESAFSVRWVIQDQIAGGGVTGVNYSNAPILVWGPYIWADGLGADNQLGGIPGNSEGLEWECIDFADDGTHPSAPEGRTKAAERLIHFFKTSEYTKGWFLHDGIVPTVNVSISPSPTKTQLTPSPTSVSQVPNTDVNHDGVTDVQDYEIVKSHFGTSNVRADINQSGKVDLFDLNLIINTINS